MVVVVVVVVMIKGERLPNCLVVVVVVEVVTRLERVGCMSCR